MAETPYCDKEHDEQVLGALTDILRSQKTDTRHKCGACAYEAGYKQGRFDADWDRKKAERADE